MPGELLTIADQSITSRKIDLTASQAYVDTDQSTTSTSYVDLATVGPAITLSPGVEQKHIIFNCPGLYCSTVQNHYSSISVAGAAAVDVEGAHNGTSNSTGVHHVTRPQLYTAKVSGTTYGAKYRTVSGTMDAFERNLVGVAI